MIRVISTETNFFLLYSYEDEKYLISAILNEKVPDVQYKYGTYYKSIPAVILSRKSISEEYDSSEMIEKLLNEIT